MLVNGLSKREMTARALRLTGLGSLLRSLGAWQGLLVLAYHRVGDGTDSCFDRDVWSATADEFDEQLRFLRQHVDFVAAKDLAEVLARRRGRCCLITFDDGYRDNHEVALPILQRHRIKALFFITTGFLDQRRPSWWDEIAWMVRTSPKPVLSASSWLSTELVLGEGDRTPAIRALLAQYKALPGDQTAAYLEYLADATGSGRCPRQVADPVWMTWDMVRDMQQHGMGIGGHTVTHPVLARLSREEQLDEIRGCGQRLQVELSEPMRYFSYPNGKQGCFNDDTRAALNAAGVEFAFSYYGGYQRWGRGDLLDIPRIAVDHDLSHACFRAIGTLPQLFS